MLGGAQEGGYSFGGHVPAQRDGGRSVSNHKIAHKVQRTQLYDPDCATHAHAYHIYGCDTAAYFES